MIGWEEALRELIKEPPFERIRHAVIDIMRSKADDRSAALTVSALTETGIIAGITTVLQPKAEDVGPLFWNKAKHGSFNQRIREAVRLGLIGTETSRNLDVIRQVESLCSLNDQGHIHDFGYRSCVRYTESSSECTVFCPFRERA